MPRLITLLVCSLFAIKALVLIDATASKSVEMQSSVDSCEKKHTHTEAFSHAGGVSHLHGEQRVHDLVEQSFLRNASARASLGKLG